jgi:aminoglycoside phosphotransferase (APT) family kinase protein
VREKERNRLLRRVDWRFVLRCHETPRAVDWASGQLSRATTVVIGAKKDHPAGADLVVLARPTAKRLSGAFGALDNGGQVYCEWRIPIPTRVRRARRALERVGFVDIQLLWPWPPPQLAPPQFWLPLDSPTALKGFMSLRAVPSSRWRALVRTLWPAVARTGLLAPVCAVARRPLDSDGGPPVDDEVEKIVAGSLYERQGGRKRPLSWVLLTGGHRSLSKVVSLVFAPGHPVPEVVVKFARVAEAERGLEREAEVLRALAETRPALRGTPRVLAVSQRAGRVALVETAVRGQPLLPALTMSRLPELALRVTRLLAELAEGGELRPRAHWWPRLVGRPLEEFERAFGGVIGAELRKQARALLEGLDDLPHACEHRDCAPWNIVLVGDGAPALMDWESADLHGLPCLDLVYFLANAAFVLDGALESGRTRETYTRLLDATTPLGAVAAACLREYCGRVGIEAHNLARLRLLCWIVHSRAEYLRLAADAGGQPGTSALRASVFLDLIREELHRQRRSRPDMEG